MWKSIVKLFKFTNKDRRFRVLILGPANAGKTTLLERLTQSPAGAAIVTRKGKRIKETPRGNDQRGNHSINDEITFESDPDFVFHDSGGFEAGGVEEVQIAWQFIRKRVVASPSQQLHAIWLCIPTDNDRPSGFLRSGFFTEPIASVPVIAIFTKLDGRETKMMNAVLGPAPSPSDFFDRAPEVEQKVAEFINRLKTQFQEQQYPPSAFMSVGNMHEDTKESVALCGLLLRVTRDALPHGTQNLLLKLTIWKRNRRVHTIHVLDRVLNGEAEENIVARTQGPGEDEASELCADKAFRTLMELYGCEKDYEYGERQLLDDESERTDICFRPRSYPIIFSSNVNHHTMSPLSLHTPTLSPDLSNGVMWDIVVVLLVVIGVLIIGIVLGSSGFGQHMGHSVISIWQRFCLCHRPSSPPPRTSMQLPIQTPPPSPPPRPSLPIPIPPPSHSATSFDTFGAPTHGQRWRP